MMRSRALGAAAGVGCESKGEGVTRTAVRGGTECNDGVGPAGIAWYC